ncbi:NUDIX hydrolase [Dyadobacter fermentans]|uniref:NUDIX hydrolase n=1 Tax=Dyadobacter fermentans (strain ATCC 700827 / DSM 18053 / CIP 107007 / KCTC 52180 / NS114) TaxID=471854 RepID=C6VRM6_DYAFD|nr:NUDIX hydrolase [Dyadobacter fermentans]ACT92729.1 NUDIX hydrolase [Dyadobacter fermentans DSM 18053]
MPSNPWLGAMKRVLALSQTGLAFQPNDYDRERYEEIRQISLDLLAHMSNAPVQQIMSLLPNDVGYITPKVDVRAVLFNAGQILMVQEKIDNDRWTLPGGWADVGYTPFEVAVKEAFEETGLRTEAVRLLAVFDKSRHDHPEEPWYVYKFFILCEVTGGEILRQTTETSDVAWVKFEDVAGLDLSENRVTYSQITRLLPFAADPTLPVLCD